MQRRIGALDLVDLNAIAQMYGHEFMPYPFRQAQPPAFLMRDEVQAHAATVRDRFHDGDLKVFDPFVVAMLHAADIWVACHVQHHPPSTPCVRILACRRDTNGYIAAQRPDADVLDIYQISPYEIGSTISDVLELTVPGGLSSIVVPTVHRRERPPRDERGLGVRDRSASANHTAIDLSQVTAYSAIQSRCLPARDWGIDYQKSGVTWVRIDDDGEYISAHDHSHAVPMTRSALHERIDRLIAEDVATLRRVREG